jgi:hypothetical protein
LKVVLGAFTSRCVERWLGGDLGAGVCLAAWHYGRRLRSARPPLPLLRPELGEELDPPVVEVEVELDPCNEALLEEEARRCGGDLQQILTHAVFVYLADLDRDRGGCGGRARGRASLR